MLLCDSRRGDKRQKKDKRRQPPGLGELGDLPPVPTPPRAGIGTGGSHFLVSIAWRRRALEGDRGRRDDGSGVAASVARNALSRRGARRRSVLWPTLLRPGKARSAARLSAGPWPKPKPMPTSGSPERLRVQRPAKPARRRARSIPRRSPRLLGI